MLFAHNVVYRLCGPRYIESLIEHRPERTKVQPDNLAFSVELRVLQHCIFLLSNLMKLLTLNP